MPQSPPQLLAEMGSKWSPEHALVKSVCTALHMSYRLCRMLVGTEDEIAAITQDKDSSQMIWFCFLTPPRTPTGVYSQRWPPDGHS